MSAKGLRIASITVSNLQEAKRFFTQLLDLDVVSEVPEYDWMELGPQGSDAAIGVGEGKEWRAPGTNAVVSILVQDMEQTKASFEKAGVNLEGEMIEVPGEVKLQSFRDPDGNELLLVEELKSPPTSNQKPQKDQLVKKMKLSWIVVNDIAQAKEFYTKVVGLTLDSEDSVFKWLELRGKEGGQRLGIGQAQGEMKAGTNAIVTFIVEDIEQAKAKLEQKGVKMVGDIIDIPGHVRLQSFEDSDGNHFQLVEEL